MKDIGIPKTLALLEQLEAINPYLNYETYTERIIPANAARLFAGCDVVCEAFDRPDQKAMLIETLLEQQPKTPIVSGSGMAGFGSANAIRTERRFGRLYPVSYTHLDVYKRQTKHTPPSSSMVGWLRPRHNTSIPM